MLQKLRCRDRTLKTHEFVEKREMDEGSWKTVKSMAWIDVSDPGDDQEATTTTCQQLTTQSLTCFQG